MPQSENAHSRNPGAPIRRCRSLQMETEMLFKAASGLRSARTQRAATRHRKQLLAMASDAGSERIRKNAAAVLLRRSERVEGSKAGPTANQIKMLWRTAHELRRARAKSDFDRRSEWRDQLEIMIVHARSPRILERCLALQADDWAHYGEGPSSEWYPGCRQIEDDAEAEFE